MSDVQPTLTAAWSNLMAALAPHTDKRAAIDPHSSAKLYERWFRQDNWRLLDEALPLLVECDPPLLAQIASTDSAVASALQQVRQNMIQDVRQRNTLTIQNPSASESDWLVMPTDLLPWAQATKIQVPDAFENLARFITLTLKSPGSSVPPEAAALAPTGASSRESVLGAALNLVAKSPAECRDELGLVSGQRVVELLKAQSFRWFDAATPPLAETEMAALIDRWLE